MSDPKHVTINTISYPAELEWDGEYVGDPLELVGSCQGSTAALCPHCDVNDWGGSLDWNCTEYLMCNSCGAEWEIKSNVA